MVVPYGKPVLFCLSIGYCVMADCPMSVEYCSVLCLVFWSIDIAYFVVNEKSDSLFKFIIVLNKYANLGFHWTLYRSLLSFTVGNCYYSREY